jgi:hypothetical protein
MIEISGEGEINEALLAVLREAYDRGQRSA